MNTLRIVDIGGGRARISWQHATTTRECPATVSVANPLTDDDREELRWYLEDYLMFPYGAERDRAARVEDEMKEWGAALFSQVFPRFDCDPDPRSFYRDAVREGLATCELCICSGNPLVLGMPWELIRDPESGGNYLAPLLAGVFRQHATAATAPLHAPVPGEPFRILYVMARPYGERDVPLGTVARPMLDALRDMRPAVELDVLRPFTFAALEKRLTANPGRYQLVHFDGHGAFMATQTTPPIYFYGARAIRGWATAAAVIGWGSLVLGAIGKGVAAGAER